MKKYLVSNKQVQMHNKLVLGGSVHSKPKPLPHFQQVKYSTQVVGKPLKFLV